MSYSKEPRPVVPLGNREKEILEFAAQGLTDKEIATKLSIRRVTVRTYWDRIRTKLNAANRTQAVTLGMPHNRLDEAAEEIAAFILRVIDHEVISICDRNGIFLTWNKGVHTIFGYDESEWIGTHNSIIFVPEDKSGARQELEDADVAGASVNYRWHLRKDGSRFWGANIVIPFPRPSSLGAYAKIVRPKADSDAGA